MEAERENITRNNIEQYLDFNWNCEKQVKEEEKGDVDWLKRRDEKGAHNNVISDRHRFH